MTVGGAGIETIGKYVWARAGEIFLALLPLAIWAINSNVVSNRLGDVDTWFYFGHFLTLGEYADVAANYTNNYYQTRLSYTIPGYLIFQIFTVEWAKLVFAYLIYGVTVGSLFYVLKTHLGRRAATLGAVFMATDIFFVRSAGWNYVDNGILAYQALTFAALTATGPGKRNFIWIALASFFFTSMCFVHAGSGLLLFPLAAYGWMRLQPKNGREWRQDIAAALLGVVVCQCLYGALNVWIWDGEFFFAVQQLEVGRNEAKHVVQWLSLDRIMNGGEWLIVHLAVWIASATALLLAAIRKIKLQPFQWFCFATVFALYLLIFVTDESKITYFMFRQGLYASFFLFPTYLAVGCLMAGDRQIPAWGASAIAALLFLMLASKLHVGGANIPGIPFVQAWSVGIAMGLLLAAGFAVGAPALKTAFFCGAAISTVLAQWQFDDTTDIYKTIAAIHQATGKDIPRIWTDKNDPLYEPVIMSAISAFTERAWWLRGEDFPDPPQEALDGDRVFVVSSRIHSLAKAQRILTPRVDHAERIRDFHVKLTKGDLWIGEFRLWNRIGVPPGFSASQLTHDGIPAVDLPSNVGRVDGQARMATNGESEMGALTYGPFAGLTPGRYRIVISYGPSTEAQEWAISSRTPLGVIVTQSGPLPATTQPNARIVIPLSLDRRTQNFEVHTQYSGHGNITVRSVAIIPLPQPVVAVRHAGP